MPSTVMKAYCEPSIVLCSIGTNRKVQDMIPTYKKAHTLAGGVRQENNQRSKKIWDQLLCKNKRIVAGGYFE